MSSKYIFSFSTARFSRKRGNNQQAFTLLEVMVALAVAGIAIVPLLALERRNLKNVTKAHDVVCAALLAQEIMARAELETFPPLGVTRGDFQNVHPGRFQGFRWERTVEPTPLFQDLRKVTVRVLYGPGFKQSFTLVEFLHNPSPIGPTAGPTW